MESYSVYPFVAGLFHSAERPQGSSLVSEFPSSLGLNSTPLYGFAVVFGLRDRGQQRWRSPLLGLAWVSYKVDGWGDSSDCCQ